MGLVGTPRDVDATWVRAGGGEEKAEVVILPREAMNFCMRPFGARMVAEAVGLARLVVERLLVRPLDGEGVKLGTGEEGLRGEGLRFVTGVLKPAGLLEVEGRRRGLSLTSVKSDIRVTWEEEERGT